MSLTELTLTSETVSTLLEILVDIFLLRHVPNDAVSTLLEILGLVCLVVVGF